MVPLMMLMEPISADDPLSYALLSFKSEILDDSNALNDWFLPSQPQPSTRIHACSWTGVKCNQNSSKITALDLSMKNLGGSFSGKQFNLFVDLVDLNLSHNAFSDQLPPGIFNITSLISLDISRNNFSGVFPTGISKLSNLVVLDAFSNSFSGPLPADVSRLDSLKILNFAGSYFSGPIPSDYGSFKSIEFIHLAGNFLNGKLPPALGNLQTLSHMEIGYNSYEGGIPWQFGNLSELNYLDISDANISGTIPYQLGNLTKLESLFLFRNRLSGKIPWELSRILSLKSLDLSDNLLSGPIPDSLSELKNLILLSLMYNDLSGSVPDGIARLPELETLLIWNNYFTGSLPEDLGRSSRLKHVDVSTNFFVGSIPTGICAGGELMKLILFSNNFTGGLSPSLSNCSSLVRLRLEDNLFSGEISLHFGNLPDISYVDLSRNMFTGGIPSDIDQSSRLEYFNVSSNPELGGVIPIKLWSLPNLQNFSMVSCGVSGNIPAFESCKSVSVIELRTNNLSGYVEESVSNCKQLVVMDLANNNLTGSIPVELASLPAISLLDLSHNGFTGPIPAKLGSSASLKLLNVSYNDISGAIPSNKTFKMMDQSAFLGNPKLCGAPLRPCSRESGISNGLELGSRRAQKLAWVLILCAVTVLFIVAAVFGVVYFRRGSKGQWKMVAFHGLPQFTPKDVLRSFNCVEAMETALALPDSIGKVVLPTGITVSAKKIEWEPKEMKVMLQFLTRIGNSRHENLVRLLGICYNNQLAYLLYDYMPNGNLAEKIGICRDWETKCRIISGVAKALCFLHHGCFPAIPHGNLKASNVLLDENMEPHLAEYGLSSIVESSENHLPAKSRNETGGFRTSIRDELDLDVYNFGELILEVLTNGRVGNTSGITQNLQREDLIRQVGDDNGIVPSSSLHKDMKSAVEVALLCTRSRPADRPTMQDALKLLPRPKGVPRKA
ncbi:Leucine-rich repeat transmembrane protein kinase family protein [Perilla frutescens var. frutescens]|nr:Leucine-rich repeat transmembrane protein kinase family protein [Perilla frutescens var. frutescens]